MSDISVNSVSSLQTTQWVSTSASNVATSQNQSESFAATLSETVTSATTSSETAAQSTAAASASTAEESTAASESSAGETQNPSCIVYTPFGAFDLNNLEPGKFAGDPTMDATRLYFFTSSPEEYRNDAEKVAEFTNTYGAQAAAVLETYGMAPENINNYYVSTPEESELYRADGVRAYYRPTDLMGMPDEARNQLVDITATELQTLLDNQDWYAKIATKSSLTLESFRSLMG
jgi:hypothetical protein